MKAERILPGVHRVLKGASNSYVVETDDGLVLVDCGIAKNTERIGQALADLGREVSEIKQILVTHHHADHIGGLAELVRRTDARVYVHGLDAAVVRGEEIRGWPEWRGLMARLIGPIVARTTPTSVEPCRVDQELHDDERLPFAGGVRIVPTPGHTAGHVSFLFEREPRTLFVGDAAVNIGGIRPSTGRFAEIATADLVAAARSFRALTELDFEAAVFGHGKPIRSGASERFRQALRRL